MTAQFDIEKIASERERLSRHKIYEAVRTQDDLRVFMQHHIYSVWDFMSLCKFLQGEFAPTSVPWVPKGDPMVRRFINEIVLEEETDQGLPGGLPGEESSFMSHYELYREAMAEVGADADSIHKFVTLAHGQGLTTALEQAAPPAAAAAFTTQTFKFIETGKPHVIAAAFALGREHIIPAMFRALLKDMAITKNDAPAFHYYLERHIHLDEDHHGPLSLRMLNACIDGDANKAREAEDAAIQAIQARIQFWDGVLEALPDNRQAAE